MTAAHSASPTRTNRSSASSAYGGLSQVGLGRLGQSSQHLRPQCRDHEQLRRLRSAMATLAP